MNSIPVTTVFFWRGRVLSGVFFLSLECVARCYVCTRFRDMDWTCAFSGLLVQYLEMLHWKHALSPKTVLEIRMDAQPPDFAVRLLDLAGSS